MPRNAEDRKERARQNTGRESGVRKQEHLSAKTAPLEVVNPLWLIKAFAVMVVVALACGYIALCFLFYQGQWQLVLHPKQMAVAPTSIQGAPFDVVHFGAGPGGTPQLTGWYLPAQPGGAFRHLTVLYLPGGDGSLVDDEGVLRQLNELGLNVFAVDYRGFGQSAALHPNEQTMTDDAESAWEFLTASRGVNAGRILLYGQGVGGALAVQLAATKASAAPVLILDGPVFDVEKRVAADRRTYLIPLKLLFHNRFALRPTLDTLHVPKLILSRSETEDPAIRSAGDPKMTVALPTSGSRDATTAQDAADGATTDLYRSALKRFLNLYAPPTPVSRLLPSPPSSSQR